VGRLPVDDMFSLFGKLGFASYDVDWHCQHSPASAAAICSDSEFRPDLRRRRRLSFGGSSKRAASSKPSTSTGDANMISVSGLFRF
jgi:hypothetical protein